MPAFYSLRVSFPLTFLLRAAVETAAPCEVIPVQDLNSVRTFTSVSDVATREDDRVPALNGVRAIAILAVIIAHSVYYSVALPPCLPTWSAASAALESAFSLC
jgi:hypothetical protein